MVLKYRHRPVLPFQDPTTEDIGFFLESSDGCPRCAVDPTRAVLRLPAGMTVEELAHASFESWTGERLEKRLLPSDERGESSLWVQPLLVPNAYLVELRGGGVPLARAEKMLSLIELLDRREGVLAEPLLYYRQDVPTLSDSPRPSGGFALSDTLRDALGWPDPSPDDMSPVTVGVLDTGIHFAHGDFAHQTGLGVNTVDGSGDWTDSLGHGTQCAGIIAAKGHVNGLLPETQLHALKAVDPDGRATQASIGDALEYARLQRLSIVNISAGGICMSDHLRKQIECLVESDTLLVASGGDDRTDLSRCSYYPATSGFSHVLSVGAHDIDRSNCGSGIHLTAPGKGLYTTTSPSSRLRKGHTSASAVSFATAVTSATAALIRSRYPQLTAPEVRELLIASCTRAGSANASCSGGRLHAGRAWAKLTDATLLHNCGAATATCSRLDADFRRPAAFRLF